MANKINFTSVYGGAGKSTVIITLARDLAEEKKNVLIIDNSNRISRLPEFFQVPRFKQTLETIEAFSTTGELSWDLVSEHITSLSERIHVIGCSTANTISVKVLEKTIALADFSGLYDYILVETPPRMSLSNCVNVFVIEAKKNWFDAVTKQGAIPLVNKFDPDCGIKLRQLGKEVVSLPYEPGMLKYENGIISAVSDDYWQALYELQTLLEDYSVETVPEDHLTRLELMRAKAGRG